MALIKNKKAYWTKIAVPEKKFGVSDTQWSIILEVTPEESKKWVKAGHAMKGRKLTHDGVELDTIKLTRDTRWKKSGDEKTPVTVVDMKGLDVDPSIIGNGSVVNVQYKAKPWKFQGREGVTAELIGVQIVELVEFKKITSDKSEFAFMADDTFSNDEEVAPF